MDPKQLTAYLALIICVLHLVQPAKQLYHNRKKGVSLPEDWGATVCAVIGFAMIALYFALPPLLLHKWHGMLAFVGANLMVAGLFARFRYLGQYSKTKPKRTPPRPNVSERIPNR